MVNVWLAPPLTLTDPDGEIEPPEPAEAEILYVRRVNAAVTLTLAVMVTVQVDDVPEHPPPDQPAKVEFAPGVAARVMDVPATKVVPDGLLVTVPLPVPVVPVVRVYVVGATAVKLALILWVAVTLLNV